MGHVGELWANKSQIQNRWGALGQAMALVGQHPPGQLRQLVAGGAAPATKGWARSRATLWVALWGGHPGQQTPKGRRG